MDLREFVIDVYDDGGKLFRETFPAGCPVPKFLKTAARLDDIRDDVAPENFALVAVQEVDGQVLPLRKFATMDLGNTVLSAHYFGFTRDFLPPGAQKVAAANLVQALKAFGRPVPEDLVKVADGLEPTTPFVDVREDMRQEEISAMQKQAFAPDPLREAVEGIRKFADGVYKNWHPLDKRRQALYLFAKGASVGMLPENLEPLRGYAEKGYGDMAVGGVQARYQFLDEEADSQPYQFLLMKQAEVDPDVFAETLAQVDERYGIDRFWGGSVLDPVLTTFSKTAGMREETGDGLRLQAGPNDDVSAKEVIDLLGSRFDIVKDQFGEDFAKQMRKNPVAVFKSLPDTTKMIISRMARGEADGTAFSIG